MQIETQKKTISKDQKSVFEFLTDLGNFESLMPENIEKFEVLDKDRFIFALKGMPQIALERKEQSEFDKIVLGAAGGKLPFTLTAHINAVNETQSEVVLSFAGEFNAMMAMMVKKPITNFMGALADNLAAI